MGNTLSKHEGPEPVEDEGYDADTEDSDPELVEDENHDADAGDLGPEAVDNERGPDAHVDTVEDTGYDADTEDSGTIVREETGGYSESNGMSNVQKKPVENAEQQIEEETGH